MTLHNAASIAYAVISVARATDHEDGQGRLAAGILSRAPGDGTKAVCREIAAAIGMEVLEIRMPNIEYHPGAMSVGVGVPFEQAVATGRPVLVVLDEAQSAENGVLTAVMGIIAKRVEGQPCAVLAITSSAGEGMVCERIAEGLGCAADAIVMHRTDAENRRLIQRVLAAID